MQPCVVRVEIQRDGNAVAIVTRKLCYSKDDRAMRAI